MGKAFAKKIKTIEDQGEKQIQAIQDKGEVKKIEKYAYDAGDSLFISKQKEIFNVLVDERLEKITDLDEKVNSDDLLYRYKSRTADVKFNEFDNVLDIVNKIRDGKTNLADVKNNQWKFKTYLGEIKKGNKPKEPKNTMLKSSIKQETRLLNCMMIILQ